MPVAYTNAVESDDCKLNKMCMLTQQFVSKSLTCRTGQATNRNATMHVQSKRMFMPQTMRQL